MSLLDVSATSVQSLKLIDDTVKAFVHFKYVCNILTDENRGRHMPILNMCLISIQR